MPERRTPGSQRPTGSRGGRAPGRRTTAAPPVRPTIGIRTGGPTRVTADVSRFAKRPASARRPGISGSARRTSAPSPKRLTGRATALCLVLLALMLAYAYPVRLYLEQAAQIQQLQNAQAAQQARIKNLSAQSAEWNDPAYIKAQARARFFMVPPGTKTYVVQTAPTPTPTTPAAAPSQPWYGQLWSNVRGADDPGTAQ